MRIVRWVLFVGGAGLFVVLFVKIGPGAVLSAFADLSWRLLVLLWFPFVLVTAFDTLGWKFAFRGDDVPFRRLLVVRLAGEAFNVTTPTASVGGEAVKAWMLRPEVPMSQSVPSVIIAKTTITVSQVLFLVVGLAVAWPVLPPGSPLLSAMQWMLVLEVIGVGGFIAVQVAGGLGGTGRLLLKVGLERTAERAQALTDMDDTLSRFYRDEPRRLCLSVAAHFLGWAFSALEAYAILHALGVPVSLTTAVVIEAFGTGIRFASFMVPAHLGALEGGHVASFLALGLSAPLGLTFSLVRRVRELAWTGLGFLVLSGLGSPVPAEPALEPEG